MLVVTQNEIMNLKWNFCWSESKVKSSNFKPQDDSLWSHLDIKSEHLKRHLKHFSPGSSTDVLWMLNGRLLDMFCSVGDGCCSFGGTNQGWSFRLITVSLPHTFSASISLYHTPCWVLLLTGKLPNFTHKCHFTSHGGGGVLHSVWKQLCNTVLRGSSSVIIRGDRGPGSETTFITEGLWYEVWAGSSKRRLCSPRRRHQTKSSVGGISVLL